MMNEIKATGRYIFCTPVDVMSASQLSAFQACIDTERYSSCRISWHYDTLGPDNNTRIPSYEKCSRKEAIDRLANGYTILFINEDYDISSR